MSKYQKVDEAIQVTLESIDESYRVKDLDVSLNTDEGNTDKTTTQLMNCELLSAIISANKKCKITIRFAERPEIVVYSKDDFEGDYYMPLKITAVSHSGNVFNFTADSWFLNNKLEFLIEGPINTLVNITLRYK